MNRNFLKYLLGIMWIPFCCGVVQAQEKKDASRKKGDVSYEKKIDSLIDGQELTAEDEEYKNIKPIPGFFKDSIQVLLRDFKISSRIDSLWVEELVNSDLYPEMRESILELEPGSEGMDVIDRKHLPTDVLKERLEALNRKTPLQISYSPELEKMIHIYLKRDKKFMERLMALSRYYFPMFEEELAKQDIPLELKYLPIIESALNPLAKSPVGATGLWQFMFSTGKMQGLSVSSYVDERMDPVKSTQAAANYLSSLYAIFEDWDLVLASYNSGPGRVSQAIRRSGGEIDYWKLKRFLPRETANYVPAFLAVYYVFNYAEEHGFEHKNSEIAYFHTDTVHIKKELKFEQISEIIDIDEELLTFLNPSFKMKVIPQIDGKSSYIRLPIQDAGLFAANEDLIYEYIQKGDEEEESDSSIENAVAEAQEEEVRYRIKSGDYLGKIANLYGVSVSNIRQWNNLPNNHRLKIGNYLTIYPNNSGRTGNPSASEKIYVVQKGDSLWTISRKFANITINQIKEWNGISGNNLKPGMKLKISEG